MYIIYIYTYNNRSERYILIPLLYPDERLPEKLSQVL